MTRIDALKSPALKFAAVAILPLLFLIFHPVTKYTVLAFGERALLKTVPVDPRDILRGDYVVLDYEISDIPEGMLPETDESGKTFYVSLSLDSDGVATVSGVSASRPGGLYLRGRLRRSWGGSHSLDYGLGVYYVPEGTGREIENAIQRGEITVVSEDTDGEIEDTVQSVEVTVLVDVRILRGRGVIKDLQIVGEEIGE